MDRRKFIGLAGLASLFGAGTAKAMMEEKLQVAKVIETHALPPHCPNPCTEISVPSSKFVTEGGSVQLGPTETLTLPGKAETSPWYPPDWMFYFTKEQRDFLSENNVMVCKSYTDITGSYTYGKPSSPLVWPKRHLDRYPGQDPDQPSTYKKPGVERTINPIRSVTRAGYMADVIIMIRTDKKVSIYKNRFASDFQVYDTLEDAVQYVGKLLITTKGGIDYGTLPTIKPGSELFLGRG